MAVGFLAIVGSVLSSVDPRPIRLDKDGKFDGSGKS